MIKNILREIDRFFWNPIDYLSGNLSKSWNARQIALRRQREMEFSAEDIDDVYYGHSW